MEYRWNDDWQDKNDEFRRRYSPVKLWPPQMSHTGLNRVKGTPWKVGVYDARAMVRQKSELTDSWLLNGDLSIT